MNQEWFCELCGKVGSVQYEEHEGVMSIVLKIGWAHRKASPGCERVVKDIRVGARGR